MRAVWRIDASHYILCTIRRWDALCAHRTPSTVYAFSMPFCQPGLAIANLESQPSWGWAQAYKRMARPNVPCQPKIGWSYTNPCTPYSRRAEEIDGAVLHPFRAVHVGLRKGGATCLTPMFRPLPRRPIGMQGLCRPVQARIKNANFFLGALFEFLELVSDSS